MNNSDTQPAYYLLDYVFPYNGPRRFNGSVARTDVIRTCEEAGLHYVNLYGPNADKVPPLRLLLRRLLYRRRLRRMAAALRPGDVVMMQYPSYTMLSLSRVVKLAGRQQARVLFLIHDLNYVRVPKKKSAVRRRLQLLNRADALLVHTPQMRDKLKAMGISVPMIPILLFDYYAVDPFPAAADCLKRKNIVAFAGNLRKSKFLRVLDAMTIPDTITFRLYGNAPKEPFVNPRMSYEGKFTHEHTGALSCGWGLVWDGDSTDTCGGSFGNYLRFIAPHKLSLYLAAGIPVVVWKESAHAAFVEEGGLGIAVGSLSEMEEKIRATTDGQYTAFVTHAQAVGRRLRQGCYLKEALSKYRSAQTGGHESNQRP